MKRLAKAVFGQAAIRWLLILPVLALSQPLQADWWLDESNSHLGFASVKNERVAENHHFTGISGGISDAGRASVIINLASVETLIPIRNERMRDMLFEVGSFPPAVVTAQVNMADYTSLAIGEQHRARVEFSLTLHRHQPEGERTHRRDSHRRGIVCGEQPWPGDGERQRLSTRGGR